MCDERPRLARVSSLLDVKAASRVQNEGAKRTKVFYRNGTWVSQLLYFSPFRLLSYYERYSAGCHDESRRSVRR